MTSFFNKHKIAIIAVAIVILIPSCLAAAKVIYRGRENINTVQSECESLLDGKTALTDILQDNGIKEILLPKKYMDICPESEKLSKGKKFTSVSVTVGVAEIEVVQYNYAYLIEDNPVAFPSGSEKIITDKGEFYIGENNDGSCTLIYYSGTSKYTIKDNCTVNQIKMIVQNI